MAKQKKNNQSVIPPVPREAIAAVQGEEDFVELLRRELEWPIPMNVQRLTDVAIPHDLQRDFGFEPEEDRIAVSRLLSLTEDQPWGVFLFEFKTKRPYLSHLRRLLRVLGSQRTLRKGDPIWDRNDLLFICTSDWSQFKFVHFSGEKSESAIISTFGWKDPDDPFLYTLCKHNLPRLRMPQTKADGGYEAEAWRTTWRDAFSVKPVTDEFYSTLKEVFNAVQAGVKGLKGEDRRFFSELVVNRMVFLKFVEKKGWLDDDRDYLHNRFQAHGRKNYWRNFLCDFFFKGLCKEKDQRAKKVNELLGNVPFLNAELFAPSDKWDDWAVEIENRVFDLLFDKLLNPYNFTVVETSPLDVEVAFNQDLLGYGYEELIADQHGQGAYYTHPTEVNLMCRESLRAYLEGRCPEVNKELVGKLVYAELTNADPVGENDALDLYRALHDVTVVDPALGSGTFPVAMMKHLFLALRTLGGYLKNSADFRKMLKQDGITDPNDTFALKLHIIERSIYGCDIDYFAVQIAKLRFWIELMVDCDKPEALPNFNCKLVVGDALVSVVGTDSRGNLITLEDLLGHPTRSTGQLNWIHSVGKKYVEKLATLKHEYFKVRDSQKRKSLEDKIAQTRNELLRSVGVQVDKIKRTDKHVLWQIDFAEIFSGMEPGFDIAISNPPYLRQELIDSSLKDFTLSTTKNILHSSYRKIINVAVGGQADLYIYFYLRAAMLCKYNGGVTCFICSNSWLDAKYGKAFQFYLLCTHNIRLIIENRNSRSFEAADINTIITVFVSAPIPNSPDSAMFLSLKMPFEEYDFNKLISKVLSDQMSIYLNTYSANCIPKKVLFEAGCVRNLPAPPLSASEADYEGSKWGGIYLRAPSIYFDALNASKELLVPLGNLVSLRRGYTTGANEFFYLQQVKRIGSLSVCQTASGEQFEIESTYLRPAIKNTRECKSYMLSQKDSSLCLFVCAEGETALRRTKAWRFVQWGESQGFHKRPTCCPRERWWDIGFREEWPLWWIIAHNERDVACLNQGLLCGDNFFEILPNQGISIRFLFAIMVSSWVTLQRELLGRSGFGGGLLKTQGPDVRRLMVPDPKKLKISVVTALETAGNRLSMKKPYSIHSAWEDSDRVNLDKMIAHTIGIGEDKAVALYKAARNLVKTRQARANS